MLASFVFASSCYLSGCNEDDDEDLCEAVTCGAHGSCDASDGSCDCEVGWVGGSCEVEVLDCGAHGSWDEVGLVCDCADGFAGSACGDCAEGYIADGEECVLGECLIDDDCADDVACNGDESCGEDHHCSVGEAVTCGEHASCVEPEGHCDCDEGYGLVEGSCLREVIASFDDLSLESESFWNGSDGAGFFTSGVVTFSNNYNEDWDSWDGFGYSNVTDTTTAGFGNQFGVIAGAGQDGSENFGVAYVSAFATDPPTLSLGDSTEGSTISGLYVTNATYPYLAIREGDAYSKQFGGDGGTDPDWFLLTIHGIASDGAETGTVDFYLADFRSENSDDDYIVDDWTFVELTALGNIVGLQFTLTSSDTGEYGMNTPAYFAIDTVLRYGF